MHDDAHSQGAGGRRVRGPSWRCAVTPVGPLTHAPVAPLVLRTGLCVRLHQVCPARWGALDVAGAAQR